MNEQQINEINKKYKIIERFNEEHTNMYINDNDETDKFYKLYKDIYLNKPKHQYIINYKPFDKFRKLSEGKCIDDPNKINMINLGIHKKYNDLEYVQYNTDHHFYKSMDGFYNIDEENKFIDKNKNVPFWFSSVYLAYLAISSRLGGINAYKTIQPVKVLIINCKNILKIIDLFKKKGDNNIKIRDNILSKKYILNLLRLSSCSENGFLHQLSIYNNFNDYDNEIWVTYKPLNDIPTRVCDIVVDNNDYFGIIKQKGKHNYNFAYLLSYINKKWFNSYFDAYVIQNKYTPYFYTGITLEEFVFFDPYNVVKRDIYDIYDWTQYKQYLDFKIIPNFKIPYMFSKYNKNFNLYKFYDQNYKSKKNEELINLSKNKISIIYLDVNNFNSININDKPDKIMNELNNFVSFMNADIYLFYHFNKSETIPFLNNYECIPQDNIYFYYKNRIDKNKARIIFFKINNIKKYPYKRKFFTEFKNIAKINYDRNIQLIKKIIDKKPNIFFLKCNLTYNSPEFEYLSDKGYYVHNIKNSIYPNDFDYVFTNIECKVDTLNYNMSYFLPIIVII
jgi:hypothetical protein